MNSHVKLILGLTTLDAALFFAQMIMIPFKATALNLSQTDLGYVNAAFALVQLFGNPSFGAVCDSISVRSSFIITFASWAGLYAVTGFAGCVHLMVVSRLFAFWALGMQAAQSAIPKLTSPGAEREEAISKIGLALGIGTIIGPLTSGLAAKVLSTSGIFYAGSVLSVIVIVTVVSQLPGETTGSEKKSDNKPSTGLLAAYISILKKPQIPLLMFIKALSFAPMIIQDPIVGMYNIKTLGVTQGETSIFAGFMGLTMVAGMGFLVPLIRGNFSPQRCYQLASLFYLVTYAGFLRYSAFWQMFVVMPWFLIGSCLIQTAVDTHIAAAVDEQESGTAFGLSNAIISLVGVACPLIGAKGEAAMGFGFVPAMGFTIAAVLLGAATLTSTEVSHDKKTN